jgi:protein-disulfide isomerase
VSLEGARTEGDPRAPVVLIEWSDYQCPFCARAETTLMPRVRESYIQTGQVQRALFHHPLVQIHKSAEKAAEAAECAGQQDMFWQMHKSLFEDQAHLELADLQRRGRRLALDEGKFQGCLDADAPAIRQQAAEAEAFSLRGTPAFLVGRRLPDGRVKVLAAFAGLPTYDLASRKIQEALTEQSMLRQTWAWWASGVGVLGCAVVAAVAVRRRAADKG